MTVAYCYDWNSLLKAPRDPYDERTANDRHDRGELYTALLGGASAPHTVVQVRLETGAVLVNFLDHELRFYMLYSFGQPEGSRLFLSEYRSSRFDEQGQKISSDIIYFKKDGLLTVLETDLTTRMTDQYNVETDVSANWEPIPTFGDYESITRFDRWADLDAIRARR
jgi:hypothetical protein